jgi:hypothetical protein
MLRLYSRVVVCEIRKIRFITLTVHARRQRVNLGGEFTKIKLYDLCDGDRHTPTQATK